MPHGVRTRGGAMGRGPLGIPLDPLALLGLLGHLGLLELHLQMLLLEQILQLAEQKIHLLFDLLTKH